jgi:hypothetical protein
LVLTGGTDLFVANGVGNSNSSQADEDEELHVWVCGWGLQTETRKEIGQQICAYHKKTIWTLYIDSILLKIFTITFLLPSLCRNSHKTQKLTTGEWLTVCTVQIFFKARWAINKEIMKVKNYGIVNWMNIVIGVRERQRLLHCNFERSRGNKQRKPKIFAVHAEGATVKNLGRVGNFCIANWRVPI